MRDTQREGRVRCPNRDNRANRTVVCTENLSSGVVVVKSAKDGV